MVRPLSFVSVSFLALAGLIVVPFGAYAAEPVPVLSLVSASTTPVVASTTPLQVSGWIPYWRSTEGARDAFSHLAELDEVYPFGYVVQTDGRLKDLAGLTKSTWSRLFREARKQGVRIIPTVMWSDTQTIQTILSDAKKRVAHEKRVIAMVENGNYAGVDIDYEGKLASTRESYSLFLQELKAGLKDKKLVCTIEARTPPESLGKSATSTPEYANDYPSIGKYCDQVNIMAYDQQRADVKLNSVRTGAPYYPNADAAWVRKVIEFAAKDIPKEKIVLSIPTYGRELSVTVAPNWYKSYNQLWSVSYSYASDTAKEYGIVPSRNAAGEMSFSYLPKDSSVILPSWVKAPANTLSGNIVAAQALSYATGSGKTAAFNLVWWSDAVAAGEKVALAKELGLKGVSFFKIDGGEDPAIWSLFK
jgi:spore germination protein YaaH